MTKLRSRAGRWGWVGAIVPLVALLLSVAPWTTFAAEAPAPVVPPPVTPPAAQPQAAPSAVSPDYVIGPGDSIQVFVWRSPELTVTVPVRPDGKISTPLVEDLVAVGKTPSQLARDIETRHMSERRKST